MKVIGAPADDEPEELKAPRFRNNLIARIQSLEQDVLEAVDNGFPNAVAQLKVANPGLELSTEGYKFMNNVVDDQIVAPEILDFGREEGGGERELTRDRHMEEDCLNFILSFCVSLACASLFCAFLDKGYAQAM